MAVPESVFSRKVASRILTKLNKAQLIEVSAASDAGDAHAILTCKVWLGFLPPGLAPAVLPGDGQPATFSFLATGSSVPILPDIDGLVAAADDFFAFASAHEPPEAWEPHPASWETRMSKLEAAFTEVQASLRQIAGQVQPTAPPGLAKPSLLKPQQKCRPSGASRTCSVRGGFEQDGPPGPWCSQDSSQGGRASPCKDRPVRVRGRRRRAPSSALSGASPWSRPWCS